jgi:hypothetical protein
MEMVTEITETKLVEKLRIGNGNSLGLFQLFSEITVLFGILPSVINSVFFRKKYLI